LCQVWEYKFIGEKISTSSSVLCGGVTRGQGGHNYPGAESLWGAKSLRGAPNDCGERQKVPNMSQVRFSIQCIYFRKTSYSNRGRQTSFLPRAPSNFVAPLVLSMTCDYFQ